MLKKLDYETKKDIVYTFEEIDFAETIIYCAEQKYITKERENYYLDNCMEYPYPTEDNYFEYNIDIIYEFFDELGIDNILFKQIVEELENENKI